MNQSTGQIAIYQTEDGKVQMEVRMEQDTVWLRQEQMSDLFGRERSVITKHLRNIFVEGELEEKSNVKNLHIAGSDKINVGLRYANPTYGTNPTYGKLLRISLQFVPMAQDYQS